jgi:serine/threonine protein kinase
MIADHPGWKVLEAYGQGRLAPEVALNLENHLADCARCCELLETAPCDSFLDRLRAAGSTAPGNTRRGSNTDPAGAPDTGVHSIPQELVDHPRYRVLGPIGEGGMGAVYRAEHRRMERVVALKVIHPGLMRNPATVQRFHQEVRAAAQLHHPNIVTAHDADQAGGLHFLVMEYIEGTSLADLVLRRGPLPVAEVCDYIRQAALGLQHAHERGMVHRDIKPANLMVQPAGPAPGSVIKILDFGLARLPRTMDGLSSGDSPTAPLTGAGTVMGTADYIAPEQAADPRAADIRADIYSLGCTLFYLLTGRAPFSDGSVEDKLARHAGTPLPPVNLFRPEMPAGLGAVLARMSAKDPADRYSTPAEVAEALAPFCPSAGSGRMPGGKRRRLFAVLVLAAAGLLAVAVVWRISSGRDKGVLPGGDKNPDRIVRNSDGSINGKPSKKDKAAPKAGLLPGNLPVTGLTEKQAAQAIQALGGRVLRSKKVPGNPVVTVRLSGFLVIDADLQTLGAFKQLKSLYLVHTKVTDTGMRYVSGLSNLSSLTLTGTGVTDAGLKWLTRLPRLRSLVLGRTKVTDEAMKYVGKLKHLRALDLQLTRVGDAGLKSLAGLVRLRTLNLYGTGFTDAGISSLEPLQNLTFLGLESTSITDRGLERLARLAGLTNLNLFMARGVGNEGMKSVARLRKLVSLDLRGTRVTDQGLQELAGLVHLASLQIGGLKVTDAGVKALTRMTRLQVLDLSDTGVTDEGVKEVIGHHTMTNLNLQGLRKVTDASLKELAGLERLQFLVLSGTGVTDAVLRDLAGLERLHFLVLSNTAVTDAGIKELARCPRLTFLGVAGVSKVSKAQLEELKKTRPQLRIQR